MEASATETFYVDVVEQRPKARHGLADESSGTAADVGKCQHIAVSSLTAEWKEIPGGDRHSRCAEPQQTEPRRHLRVILGLYWLL